MPSVRSIISRRRGQGNFAVHALIAARQYEDDKAWFVYLRGLPHLSAQDGEESAAAFQKVLKNPGWIGSEYFFPLAQLGLARAYAMRAEYAKARAAYDTFFATWKNADPGIPFLR